VRAVPRCRKPVGDGAMRVRRAVGRCCVHRVQAARQVGLQVAHVLQPHGQADHALRDAGGQALRFAQAAVRGAGRVGDGGLGVAQVGGDAADARGVDHGEGVAPRASAPSPRTTKDTTAPPLPACCAIASACCGCEAARGGRRARRRLRFEPACASSSARALCACMRIDSVSRPLSTTQALKGDRSCRRCASPARTSAR
jgi:hypothetical protein